MSKFIYCVQVSIQSLTRSRYLSCQIILAIAFGIAAFSATSGALSSLTGDPLKGKGQEVYHPQVDPRPLNVTDRSKEPPDDLTLRDARAIFQFSPSNRRVITSLNWLPLESEAGPSHQVQTKMVITRAATADFFKMFEVPFAFGSAWSAQLDGDGTAVVVISRALNLKLFGGGNSVGRHLQIAGRQFTIIGVTGDWEVIPRVYDLNDGAYSDSEEVFLPFETWLNLPQDYGYGPMNCWSNQQADLNHNPRSETCTWVQLWVQLHTDEVSHYRDLLSGYSSQQKGLGRFQRDANIRLRNAIEWLDYKQVVPDAIHIQYWVALGLLSVCLVSAGALLGVKFRGDFPELGIRRALGASKLQIFTELLAQGAVIGMLGGLLGLGLGYIALRIMGNSGQDYAQFMSISLGDALLSVIVALSSTLAATLIPAIVAAGSPPYQQMITR